MSASRPVEATSAGALARALRPPPAVARSGRAVLAVAGLGQAYALLLLVSQWSAYTRPGTVLGLWLLLTGLVPLLVLLAARRGGRAPFAAVLPVVLALVLADGGVPALTRAAVRLEAPGWNWGAVALVLVALGVLRPAAEVLALTAGHAAAALAWAAATAAAGVPVDPVNLTLLVAGCVLPPLAALQFVGVYLGVLERRELAVRRRQEDEVAARARDAVGRDSRARLSRVREEALPLLRAVSEGAALPLDAEGAAAARRTAERLRAELVEGREVDWLLQERVRADRAADGADGTGGADGPDVRLLTGLGASRALSEDHRAALAGLVSLLRRHPGWTGITLTVAAAPDATLPVAVVARGSAAVAARADPAVRAAVARLAGTCTLDPGPALVVQAVLPAADPAAAPAAAEVP